jgi:hypothetical protein
MTWLIPILGGLSGAITLFLSRPERPRWALATLCLILIAAGWQSASQYSQQKTTDALNERTHRDLESSVSSFLLMLGYLNVAASDGRLPANEEDFFSEKTADTICNHLNIQGKSMSLPALPWWQYSGVEAERFSQQISSILTSRASSLSPEIVKVLTRQENSLLVAYLTAHRMYGSQYLPNSFCSGAHTGVASALRDLHELYTVVKSSSSISGHSIEEPWKYLGRRDLFGVPGRNRI